MTGVLSISRFRYDVGATDVARTELAACLDDLRSCPGYLDGVVGRALDDPALWVLQTRWASVGAYRRALSSYQVKVSMGLVMSQVVDEPSAYEILVGEGATNPNEAQPRGTVP